jgi:hypothetical protein
MHREQPIWLDVGHPDSYAVVVRGGISSCSVAICSLTAVRAESRRNAALSIFDSSSRNRAKSTPATCPCSLRSCTWSRVAAAYSRQSSTHFSHGSSGTMRLGYSIVGQSRCMEIHWPSSSRWIRETKPLLASQRANLVPSVEPYSRSKFPLMIAARVAST